MKFVFEWSTPPVPERREKVTIHAKDLREARWKLNDMIDAEVFSWKLIEPKPPAKEAQ